METLSPPPEPDHSFQIFAVVPKPHLQYKCLLNQHAQKLRKPPPVYQTQNEGTEHLPKFRTTIWVDGVSYTSSSTFQQRRMSEMDASKIAYIAVTQKAKADALHFIQQDKTFCKSVLAEFAAKKKIGKPVYETTQLEALGPVFHSYLHFNGGTYPGDSAKSKKEAEQLVARSVIIQYLDSEFGTDMADIVYCKLRYYHEINKVQEINRMQSGSNVLGAQARVGHNSALTESGTSTMAKSSAAPESSLVQGTMVPATLSSGVHQPVIPQVLIKPITTAAPVVIKPPAPQGSTEPVNPTIPLGSQPPTPQASVEPIKPVVESLVLAPVPSAAINNSCTPVVSATMVKIPATTNAIPQPKPEASPPQALEYIPLVDEAPQKKIRSDT